ncbi:MAG: RNA polymerase sigma factor, partial [Verrucomicrobia bacterium]|nr:RNA polymerase sigma factor [Verrucomicrobiota bacterium]
MDEREQSSLFREWYKNHLGIIVRIARANAVNPHDQEDLIQEISIQIWNSIPQFKGKSKESTFIYRVAINTAITRSRKEIRQLEKKRNLSENLRFMKETTEHPNDKLEWIFEQ